MEPVPINRFNNGTDSDKPVWKLNRFIKKPVLEPVYETGLPALIKSFNRTSGLEVRESKNIT